MSKKSRKRKSQNQNKALLIGAAVVVLALVGGALVFSQNQPASPTAGEMPLEVSVQQAYAHYEEGGYILDVRTPAEWNEGHVPGATLIPLDELPNRLSEVPEGEEVYVICRSGNRSATARDILLQSGFEQVTSVGGGFNDWQQNNYPVATGP